jgi:hypothetical protein
MSNTKSLSTTKIDSFLDIGLPGSAAFQTRAPSFPSAVAILVPSGLYATAIKQLAAAQKEFLVTNVRALR